MHRKTMKIISTQRLSQLSKHIPFFVLVAYDKARYRNNPTIEKWVGRKLVGLPSESLALVASEGVDTIGKYISLYIAMPVPTPV
jgi:hypothetical protein